METTATPTEKKTITIECDNRPFTVDVRAARMSTMIKNLMDDCPTLDAPIPITAMDADLLATCLRYCEYHAEHDDPDSPPPISKDHSLKLFVFSDWDEAFLPVEPRPVIQLINATAFLDIPRLYELTTKALARLFFGKTTAEIRTTFEIVNDLTPEEEAKIAEENPWVEEY
jgi:S-phase kinase-associated protein 1